MLCERYHCQLSTEICLKRQEKAKSQSESLSFCESLIFCNKCEQGSKISIKENKIYDLDIFKLKKKTIKDLICRKDFRMFKIKRVELKRKPKRIQLKRRR